jgi:hypothetical protein
MTFLQMALWEQFVARQILGRNSKKEEDTAKYKGYYMVAVAHVNEGGY